MKAEGESLAARLAGGCALVHREAERRPFMVQFLKAKLPLEAYGEWLVRQSFVYEELEAADEALRTSRLGVMYSPELHRSAAIAKDLAYFGLTRPTTMTPATKAYVDRIRWAREEQSAAFVSHQWLRYLGNLLGQEVLRNILNRASGLTEDGTTFYRYPLVEDSKVYLRAYHARMNSLEISDEQQNALVDEGSVAFQLNIDLTDELGRDFGIGEFSADETEAVVAKAAAEHP